MHLDDLTARRTQAGGIAVHGIHVVLWALDEVAGVTNCSALTALKVEFSSFIRTDRDVTLVLRRRREAEAKIDALVNGQKSATITMTFGLTARPFDALLVKDLPEVPLGDDPLAPTQDAMRRFSGWLNPSAPESDFQNAFPRICRTLGPRRVAAMALLSTLTGMVCPGLHSIFSGVSIEFPGNVEGRVGIGARTKAVDSRVRMVTLSIAGSGIAGEITTFERFPPVESSLERVRTLVRRNEFANRAALIIGGSRGLGAATAKLIVAGGGRVVLSYFRGVKEAEQLRAELAPEFGESSCRLLQFDIGKQDRSCLEALRGEVTHLYYFATPLIAKQGKDLFDHKVFDEFIRFYVIGLAEVVDALTQAKTRSALSVFYPSSIFVEQRPKSMTEYAMAKAAGEIFLQDLARNRPDLAITAPRLPRILTDQTASVPPIKSIDALDALLPLLRSEAGTAAGGLT